MTTLRPTSTAGHCRSLQVGAGPTTERNEPTQTHPARVKILDCISGRRIMGPSSTHRLTKRSHRPDEDRGSGVSLVSNRATLHHGATSHRRRPIYSPHMPDARDISDPARDDRGLLTALVGDGRPPLLFTGTALVLSGAFALFLSATRHFLPHDVRYLGMTAEQLCAMHQCKIVHFMFHDRVAFGGVLVAVGAIYMWLAEFPLRRGEPWAWWLLVVSGLVGFGSFLAYLGYGYLATWHGVATLALLPVFVAGLSKSRQRLREPRGFRALFTPSLPLDWTTRFGFGRMCLIAVALGLIVGGLTITAVGITVVFVPQDLAYMGLREADLRAVSPRLIPLIAHDRAGF